MEGDVNLKMLKTAKEKDEMILNCFKTSSKEWDDFNVHKAFNKTFAGALKYQCETDLIPNQSVPEQVP